MSNSRVIRDTNFSVALHKRLKSLTCLMTFLAALGTFMLTKDHDVPPVQGKLNHSKTGLPPGKELTISNTYSRYLSSSKLCFSVNWTTLHPTVTSRDMSLNLEFGLQQISTSNLLGLRPALGSPELPLDATTWGCGLSVDLDGLPLTGTCDMRDKANFHFSALVNGLVRMSATCILEGP